MTIHEEGTGITWNQNIMVDAKTEAFLIEATNDLLRWSVNLALTPKLAKQRAQELGERLYHTFIGKEGEKVLVNITPTAMLLDVDETILNLPWELITATQGPLSLATPFGPLVSTRSVRSRVAILCRKIG